MTVSSPPIRTRLLSVLSFCLLCTSISGTRPALGQDATGAVALQQQIATLQQLRVELEHGHQRVRQGIGALRDRLNREDRKLTTEQVSAPLLRSARLATETGLSRLSALDSRIDYRNRQLRNLDQQISLRDSEIDTLNKETSVPTDATRELQDLRHLRTATAELLATLEALRQSARTRLRLTRERLNLLQSRVQLSHLDGDVSADDSPRIRLLDRVIATLIRDNIRLANDAAGIPADSPGNIARRQLLELQADDAVVRISLRQADLDLLRHRRRLELLNSLPDDHSIPLRILEDADAELDQVRQQLQTGLARLAREDALIDTQSKLLVPGLQAGLQELLAETANIILDLDNLIAFQRTDIETLLTRSEGIGNALVSATERARARSLMTHTPLPQTQGGWQRVSSDLGRIPEQVSDHLGNLLQQSARKVSSVSGLQWSQLAGVLLVLLIVLVALRRWSDHSDSGRNPARRQAGWGPTVRMLAGAAVAIAAWLVVARIFGLSQSATLAATMILLSWPVLRLLLAIARAGTEFRMLVWIAVFAIASVGLHAAGTVSALAPASEGVLNRLAMVCMLLVALFAVRLGRNLRQHPGDRRRYSVLARVSTLAGLGLGVTSIIGLAGYTNLAWVAVGYVLWALAVVAVLLWVLGRLSFGIDRLADRVRGGQPEQASRWIQNVTRPFYWLCATLLTLVAAYLLLYIYGWDSDTPVIGRYLVLIGLGSSDLLGLWQSETGRQISAAALEILVAVVLAYVGWELVRRAIEPYMPVEHDESALPAGDIGGTGASRISTLMPLLRKFLLVTIVAVTVMVVLSALGVNIGPLLAGAGVVGLAIGFGSQALVKDIVSGLFFLMDDAFRKGEYIDIGSVMGTVERISIRSLQLRHHNGPVHTVPYGEIQYLTNYSRDWAIMKFELRLPFETDLDKVRRIIKKVGIQLMEDEEFGPLLLEPLKSQGVNRMDDSALILRCKFTSVPGQQFYVRREAFNRIQLAFEEKGIKFAPRRVIVETSTGETLPTPALLAAAGAAVAATAEPVAAPPDPATDVDR